VRRIIRSKLTRTFLAADGSWTDDISSALDFQNISAADAKKQELRLRDVEVFFYFNECKDRNLDFTLPL
jgi:hypothetical protein